MTTERLFPLFMGLNLPLGKAS